MHLGNPGHLTFRPVTPVLVRLAHELNKQEPPTPGRDEGSTNAPDESRNDGRSSESA